ncbi:hypothetical protein OK142_20860 [Agrobacterium sp. BT-220-3]|nr:hypothetical protein [Agrobacterium sp. BT-220-3]
MSESLTQDEIESRFQGIWRRFENKSTDSITPELIEKWASEKGLSNISARAEDVGAFNTTPSIVLEANGRKACFPTIPHTGDSAWETRRVAREQEALLWDKVEWFLPLWIPLGKVGELLQSVKHGSRQRAIEFFDYHTSTLYTLPFQAICIAQIMPMARSLEEIVPLAREAYLSQYAGYRASSIAALIPAIEGALTRIASNLPQDSSVHDKIDHAINRAIRTAAELHFDRMWVPSEYKEPTYLFAQDERVFAFETFRRWLKNHFFCRTEIYQGVTWLNRNMFAHGTASSWQKATNFQRLVVALATLAAIESWYDETHRVPFWLPEMNDDSKLLWQQALFRGEAQMLQNTMEEKIYHKHGRLVPKMPTDNGVLLRKALLSQECMEDLVRPLRQAGWSVVVNEPDTEALYVTVTASDRVESFSIALLHSCATENAIYRQLADTCKVILYRGSPYRQDSFASGISIHVGPVLGWQPPKAA